MKKLKRTLETRFKELSNLDQYGEPDDCNEMDNAQTVADCGRLAARYGAPVEPERALMTTREALAAIGRLLAWLEARNKPELLSVNDVATMLGASVRSVWRMVSAEEIPQPVKIGGLTKWRKDDLQAMIELLPHS